MSAYEKLRKLYEAYHEDNCVSMSCDCEAQAVVESFDLYREIVKEYEEKGL